MEIAIQKIAIISLFVIGLSHAVQPRAWAEFFIYLHGKNKVGSLINALIHFPIGALIVSFHNVWEGIPIILTILGYGWLLKSFLYLVFPAYGNRILARVSIERSKGFVAVGAAMIGISGLLLFSLIREF